MDQEAAQIDVKVEEKSSVEKRVKVVVPRVLYDRSYNRLLSQKTSSAHLKGFRQGRAPKALVNKAFASEIKSQTISDLVGSAVEDEYRNQGWSVYGSPVLSEVSMEEGQPLEAEFTVYLKPSVQVSQYKDVDVEVEVEQFRDEEVDHRLLHLQQGVGSLEEASDLEVAKVHTFALVVMRVRVDGQLIYTSEAFPLAVKEGGNGSKEDELSAEFLNKPRGHIYRKTDTVQVGEEGLADYSGKVGEYDYEMVGIQKLRPHDLNEELPKKVGFQGSLAELREFMESQLKMEIEANNERARDQALMSKLIELNPFDVPQPMVDVFIKEMLEEWSEGQGRKLELSESDVERYRPLLGMVAEFRAKRFLLLDALSKFEEMRLVEGEWEDFLQRSAAHYRMPIEQFNSLIKSGNQEKLWRNSAAQEKTIKVLGAINRVTEKPKEPVKCDSHG